MHPWCRCHHNPVVDDWDKWIDDYEKRHGSAGNRLQDIFKDDKIKVARISQQVFDNLHSPDLDFLTKAQNEKLRQGMKNLLGKVNGKPEGTECSYYYNIRAGFLKWIMGDPGAYSVELYNPGIDFITIHNHFSGGTFSIKDINLFVSTEKMKVLIVVGHNGNQYILIKTNSFNGKDFIKKYSDYLTQNSSEAKDVNEFLNNANQFLLRSQKKYGFEYKKITG